MSKNMEEYINDHLIVYENKNATKAETEAALKRLDARENKISETFFQDKLKNIQNKPTKKLSKREEYDIYFNKKSPKYYNRETLQEKAKKIKALQTKSNGLYKPPSPPMDSFDWDLWLRDRPNYQTLEDEEKQSGILEQDLANEYWQEQYQIYLDNGGTLDFKKFMQQELNKKVSQKINKIAEEKRQTEGLAAILGVSSGRTT